MIKHIIQQLARLGYQVSVHRMGGGISLSGRELPVPDRYVEMHAVCEGDPPVVHIARVDGVGPDAEYRCVCELALLVGLDLEDG
jgi:hypothetical protein